VKQFDFYNSDALLGFHHRVLLQGNSIHFTALHDYSFEIYLFVSILATYVLMFRLLSSSGPLHGKLYTYIFFTCHAHLSILNKLVVKIEGASKRALHWHSKCYCVASITKTFAFKGIQTIHISRCWTMDSLYAFKYKHFHNSATQ
jgi:hypothetical protein